MRRQEIGKNYITGSFIKDGEIGRACETNGEKRNAYTLLAVKAEGERPLGRPRCMWAFNRSQRLGWGGMDWIDLAWDRGQWRALVNTVMNLRVS
jgi:hypothetical protein